MEREQILKQNIMRRVRLIHLWRRYQGAVVKALVILALVVAEVSLVSFTDVYRNMTSVQDFGALMSFFRSAILNAEIIVQALALAFVVAIVWFSRDLFSQARRTTLPVKARV